jgi:hypothetical protein
MPARLEMAATVIALSGRDSTNASVASRIRSSEARLRACCGGRSDGVTIIK